jgi:hypothetical protein
VIRPLLAGTAMALAGAIGWTVLLAPGRCVGAAEVVAPIPALGQAA